jgi:hypothetical protein
MHDPRNDPQRPLIEGGISARQLRAWVAYQGLRDLEQRVWLARNGVLPFSGGGEVTLRKTQAALETTRGTDLAATRKVYTKGQMTKDLNFQVPEEDRGTFIKQYRSTLGVAIAAFPQTGGATYEDLPWWCQLWLKGGVTGVLSNVAVYTYTFVPTPGTDDIKSATFEWGDDTQAFQMNFGMVDTFDITGALDSFWHLDIGVIGANMDTTTFTGALSDRTTEDINTYLTKLALGAAGAVPSSYMTGRFISFKLSGKNNLNRKWFADGTSPAIGGMGRGKREFTLEVTMEGNAATITERGVWEAGTNRVARVTATGSNIPASSPTTAKSADIIVPGKWSAYVVGERETNTIFTGTLMSEYDGTLTYDISVAIANALATLP